MVAMNRLPIKAIAWTIGVAIIVVALLLTVLYGHNFGYFKSIIWLTGIFVSVATSLLVVEPIKQLAFSLYMTTCTNRTHFDIDVERKTGCNKMDAYQEAFDKYAQMKVQDPTCSDDHGYKADAEKVAVEKYLLYYRDLTSDLFVFALYLLTLLLVVLGSRDSMAFYSNRMTTAFTVKSKYVRGPLKPIIGDNDFHEYLSKVLLSTLHSSNLCLLYFLVLNNLISFH